MDKKIIIIGSGPSGIATATKLIEFGYKNVIILEAENRIGGRICTEEYGENVLDLGAQWCHGEKNNVVYDIATKYQSDIFDPTPVIYKKFACVKSNKEQLSKDLVTRLTEIIDEHFNSDKATEEMKKFKGSVGEFLSEKFYDTLKQPQYADINKSDADKFFTFYSKFECSIDACDTLYDISCPGVASYWTCDGNQLLNWKGKGYITILKILMNSTEEKPHGVLENKILLNKKVEEICWKQNDSGKIYVKCSDGEKIESDHIICTVSLGVLKDKYTKLFNPLLPELKVRAIEGLGMGNVDKMFIEFSHPFWPKDWTGVCFLWEDDDLKAVRKRDDSWIEDVIGFFPVDLQPKIICAWIVGANGRRMEAASEDDVLNGLLYLLKKFLSWDIPTPKSFKRSTWYINPNFRGSYSFHSMRADELHTCAADLAYPLTNDDGIPALQFAGEATHDHFFSTVHGAVESGWREATRLYDFYNNRDQLNSKQFTTSSATNNGIFTNNRRNSNDNNETNIYDVIVLGAGLAGLGAGLYLKEQQNLNEINLKFCILEAQDYIGGRIRSVHMHSTNNSKLSNVNNMRDIIDSGAQWLHGEYNKLYEIASEFNLLAKELSEEGLGSYICDDGEIVDDFFQRKIDFKIGQILEDCEKFISYEEQNENNEENNENYLKSIKSVGDYFKEKFCEYLENEDFNENEYNNALKLYDWHKRFEMIDNSCLNLEQVSAKYWGLYSYNGENCQAHINFKNGFSTIIYDALINLIGLNNIKLNTEICDINWDVLENNKYNYNDDNNQNKENNPCNNNCNNKIKTNDFSSYNSHKDLIRIQTRDKRFYYAKHIIVTFSLGVLKLNEHKLFTPNLPYQISNAIQSIGFETINKLFLQFDEQWWLPMNGIQLLFNDSSYQNCNWTRYLSGFDVLQPGSPNTLVGWVGSYGAVEMEKLTDEEIIEDCINLLRKFTKMKVPYPIKFYCSRWNSNKFIGGAYSFLSTKCDKSCITGKKLSIPITLNDLKSSKILTNDDENATETENIEHQNNTENNDQRDNFNLTNELIQNSNYPLILLAGEACHDKYFSTAHGAFESGYEQAQKILQFYSLNKII